MMSKIIELKTKSMEIVIFLCFGIEPYFDSEII